MTEQAQDKNKNESKKPQTPEEKFGGMTPLRLKILIRNDEVNQGLDKRKIFRTTGLSTITETEAKYIQELIKTKEAETSSSTDEQIDTKDNKSSQVAWLAAAAVTAWIGMIGLVGLDPMRGPEFSEVTLENKTRIASSPVVGQAVEDYVRNEAARHFYNSTGIETQAPPVAKKPSFRQKLNNLFAKKF